MAKDKKRKEAGVQSLIVLDKAELPPAGAAIWNSSGVRSCRGTCVALFVWGVRRVLTSPIVAINKRPEKSPHGQGLRDWFVEEERPLRARKLKAT